MIRLVLDIPSQKELDALLPLLEYLNIPFVKVHTMVKEYVSLEEAIKIIRKGCDMSSFGDGLTFQRNSRQDRELPYRD